MPALNAVAIFVASFAVVFALVMQQYNVTAGHKAAAFATSLGISTMTLVQFKLLPGPTSWVEIAAYLIGSALGINTCMWAYPRWLKRRRVAQQLPPPGDDAVKLSEMLRLGATIANYAARSDIETNCRQVETIDKLRWWDTLNLEADGALEAQFVSNAIAYLHLRGQITRHPALPHLVRFKS